jgi:HlyD family secretion protein
MTMDRLRTVALLVGLTTFLGCGGTPSVKLENAKKDATAVTIVHPRKQSLERAVEQPGTIQAYEEAQLFGRVPGFVSQVRVDIGQSVRGPKRDSSGREIEPGEPLAVIAVPELDEEVAQKAALVRQAKAEVEQSRRALASAEAAIATADAAVIEAKAHQSRWESELKRIVSLVASGVIDAQTRDETTHQFRSAEARVQLTTAAVVKSKADRDKAKADVAAAEARVAVAEADARRVLAFQSYAVIRAPFDGVVTKRKINVGDYVTPIAPKADALFAITRLDPVRVVVSIPEADSEFVREKAAATLHIPALAQPTRKGIVTRTAWALEPGSRTLRAEIDLPNHDGGLRPGMYLSARIVGPLPEAWTLPASALVRQGDQTVCFVIDGSAAHKTAVRIGRGDGSSTEVFSRFVGGEWTPWDGTERIAGNPAGLSDGQTVTVKSSE